MRRKIIILVASSVLVSLASLGILSYVLVRGSIERSFEEHAIFASMISGEIDYDLQANTSRLHDIYLSGKVDLDDGDMSPERESLKTVYKYSIFSDGVFIVDRQGDTRITYPYRTEDLTNALSVPAIEKALFGGNIEISDVYTDNRTGKKFIYVVVPIKGHDGAVTGAVGGMIDPTDYVFSKVIRNAPYKEEHIIELVDSRGAVIASNRVDRILTLSDHNRFMEGLIASGRPVTVRCHRCHAMSGEKKVPERSDILVFSPLSSAPWGVVIRMPEDVAFKPTRGLLRAILALGVVLIASSLFLAAGLSRSIVLPVQKLTRSTRMIADGELESPVEGGGEDEIGELADSLETMRGKLSGLVNASLEYSSTLEAEVEERTREAVMRKKQLASLLDEIIMTQEDERKRIAQELHDDTAQTIAALGMSIDIAVQALEDNRLRPQMLMELREKISLLLDDVGRIIKNLRPSVLDDLGLGPALHWIMDRQLRPRGIRYYIDTDAIGQGTFKKQSELSVFRMIQEAISNVVKHSEATHVSLSFKEKGGEIQIEVIDNGVGFKPEDVERQMQNDDLKGFGILGIRERVEQLGGEIEIVSSPGDGTGIYITVPAMNMEMANGKD